MPAPIRILIAAGITTLAIVVAGCGTEEERTEPTPDAARAEPPAEMGRIDVEPQQPEAHRSDAGSQPDDAANRHPGSTEARAVEGRLERRYPQYAGIHFDRSLAVISFAGLDALDHDDLWSDLGEFNFDPNNTELRSVINSRADLMAAKRAIIDEISTRSDAGALSAISVSPVRNRTVVELVRDESTSELEQVILKAGQEFGEDAVLVELIETHIQADAGSGGQ